MVEHVHSGREEHTLVRLTGAPANDFRQEGLSNPGIPNNDHAGALVQEIEIQHAHDAVFEFHAALVMLEVKAVDGLLSVQPRQTKTALDRAIVARFQFEVGKRFEGWRKAQVLGRGISDRLIQLAAQRGQAELIQLRVQ